MSVPAILNVIVISGIFILIFGIIGVNYNKGKYYYCSYDKDFGTIITKWDCLNLGGEWVNSYQNFDRVTEALASLFTLMTTVGWQQFMYYGISIVGVDRQPEESYNMPTGIFYVMYIIIANFFIANLFVGVVISNYNREKENIGKDFLLSKNQKKWLETKLMLIKAKPKLL
jgi:hypothetical protein